MAMLLSKRLKYLGWIGLFVAGIAGGTPPRPPAELELLNRAALSKAEPRDGSFPIAFRVIRNEEVSDLSIRVRVLTIDPIKPSEVPASCLKIRLGARRLDPSHPAHPAELLFRVHLA